MILIDAIFISHTCHLAGWDIDEIFKDTLFKRSATTFRVPKDGNFDMLDWDFRRIEKRGLDHTWKKHFQIVKDHKPDVVMSPDLWRDNWGFALRKYRALRKICDRVVMPIHIKPKRTDLDLAFPMGVWTKKKDTVAVWDVSDQVTHLLGGSPHAQIEMSGYFPNLRSVDGNQIYVIALRFGKYWDHQWIKPDPQLTTEECFRRSIRNFSDHWESM